MEVYESTNAAAEYEIPNEISPGDTKGFRARDPPRWQVENSDGRKSTAPKTHGIKQRRDRAVAMPVDRPGLL